MTDNEIVKALYSMYCATVYKDTVKMSKETAIGLYEYFNRQKANLDDKEGTIQYADKEIKRLNAEVEELTAKISVRDKLLDIAETKINATENHCQYLRKLYNEKVCLCEEQKAEIEQWQGGYMTQKQEIANLEIELKAMRGAANSYKAEIENLEKMVQELVATNENLEIACAENKVRAVTQNFIKAEAYKECIEKIQNQIKNNNAISAEWLREYLNNLLKELVGEDG